MGGVGLQLVAGRPRRVDSAPASCRSRCRLWLGVPGLTLGLDPAPLPLPALPGRAGARTPQIIPPLRFRGGAVGVCWGEASPE